MRIMIEEVYDEQISPMMTKIIEICKENKISVFCTFGLDPAEDGEENEEDGLPPTLWCTTNLPLSDRQIDKDKINKLYKVQYENYDIVPPFTAFTITT